MNKTIDYFIDSENDLASFEYYFEEELNIKSVTLKSIMFYTAYKDFKYGIFFEPNTSRLNYSVDPEYEFSLNNYCIFLNDYVISDHNRFVIAEYVRFHSDKNHIIIELLKDGEYSLPDPDPEPIYVSFNEVFGFTETFISKGKYRSPKSIIDTPPILFLRSNLVDKQNTFYNNKYSDIICHFPTDIDKDAQKLQTYEPLNCTKNVYKCTNHLKFEITDENGKVINFRGKPVKIHLSFEVFPFNK